MFDLENVSVAYGNTKVLKRVSLKILNGEKVALIGPSGAGKSTLLRRLYEMHHKKSAFIHQDFALVPQLSAFHNVYTGRLDRYSLWHNLLNLVRPQRNEIEQIRPVFKALGIEDRMFSRVSALSGGQQQRVAVARAIYRGSEIILGDEPVSSVDPHHASAVIDLLLKAAPTVILSLHSVHLALEFFDRIVGLQNGKIFFDLQRSEIDNKLLSRLYRPC